MTKNDAMSDYKEESSRPAAGEAMEAAKTLLSALLGQAWARRFLPVFALILLLAVPQLIAGNFWIRVLVQAGLGIVLALGLNVMVGYAGLLNLGYAGFYAMGAYTYALLASPQHEIHLPFLVLFPLAGILTALVGALLCLPALPLRGDYLAMVTLGFGEIIRLLINNLDPITNGPMGIISIDHPRILFWVLKTPRDYYYVLLIVCVVVIVLMRRLERSRIGRAWTAIREDEEAARAMGINTTRLKLLACAIGAAPAGLAGALYAGVQTFVSPRSFTLMESIAVLSMVIIGGSGSVPGVVIGALLLSILPEPLRQYAASYRMAIYGALLTLFALFRSQGIWPRGYRELRSSEGLERRAEVNRAVEASGEGRTGA